MPVIRAFFCINVAGTFSEPAHALQDPPAPNSRLNAHQFPARFDAKFFAAPGDDIAAESAEPHDELQNVFELRKDGFERLSGIAGEAPGVVHRGQRTNQPADIEKKDGFPTTGGGPE